MSFGNVYTNFIEPPFAFTYIGFEFLQPLPGNGMFFYFWFMGLLAVLIAQGAWYRFAIITFAILWTLQYLMQKSGYNNHYYLILLLSWLMALVPANGSFSIDAKRKSITATNKPSPLVDTTIDLAREKWHSFTHSQWLTKNNP